jgi:hypothetical protein
MTEVVVRIYLGMMSRRRMTLCHGVPFPKTTIVKKMPSNSGLVSIFHFAGPHRSPEKEKGAAKVHSPALGRRPKPNRSVYVLLGDTTMWSTRIRIVRPEYFHLAGNSAVFAGMEK